MPYESKQQLQQDLDMSLSQVKGLVSELNAANATIAALVEDKRLLREALSTCAWMIEAGDFPKDSIGAKAAREARELLAKMEKVEATT